MSTNTFRVTIEHDPDTESPNEYGIGRVVSFNTRHNSYVDPERILECRWEGELFDEGGESLGIVQCGNLPHDPDNATNYGLPLPTHEYQRDPDVLALLSYGEHGLCRWWVADGGYGTFGHWDAVQVAGALIWQGDDSEREWWASRTDAERREAYDLICQNYTDWCNGETYYYMIERWEVGDTCDKCGHGEADWVTEDSCGGFIGDEFVIDEVVAYLSYPLEDADENEVDIEVEVVGDYVPYGIDGEDLVVRAREVVGKRRARDALEAV